MSGVSVIYSAKFLTENTLQKLKETSSPGKNGISCRFVWVVKNTNFGLERLDLRPWVFRLLHVGTT